MTYKVLSVNTRSYLFSFLTIKDLLCARRYGKHFRAIVDYFLGLNLSSNEILKDLIRYINKPVKRGYQPDTIKITSPKLYTNILNKTECPNDDDFFAAMKVFSNYVLQEKPKKWKFDPASKNNKFTQFLSNPKSSLKDLTFITEHLHFQNEDPTPLFQITRENRKQLTQILKALEGAQIKVKKCVLTHNLFKRADPIKQMMPYLDSCQLITINIFFYDEVNSIEMTDFLVHTLNRHVNTLRALQLYVRYTPEIYMLDLILSLKKLHTLVLHMESPGLLSSFMEDPKYISQLSNIFDLPFLKTIQLNSELDSVIGELLFSHGFLRNNSSKGGFNFNLMYTHFCEFLDGAKQAILEKYPNHVKNCDKNSIDFISNFVKFLVKKEKYYILTKHIILDEITFDIIYLLLQTNNPELYQNDNIIKREEMENYFNKCMALILKTEEDLTISGIVLDPKIDKMDFYLNNDEFFLQYNFSEKELTCILLTANFSNIDDFNSLYGLRLKDMTIDNQFLTVLNNLFDTKKIVSIFFVAVYFISFSCFKTFMSTGLSNTLKDLLFTFTEKEYNLFMKLYLERKLQLRSIEIKVIITCIKTHEKIYQVISKLLRSNILSTVEGYALSFENKVQKDQYVRLSNISYKKDIPQDQIHNKMLRYLKLHYIGQDENLHYVPFLELSEINMSHSSIQHMILVLKARTSFLLLRNVKIQKIDDLKYWSGDYLHIEYTKLDPIILQEVIKLPTFRYLAIFRCFYTLDDYLKVLGSSKFILLESIRITEKAFRITFNLKSGKFVVAFLNGNCDPNINSEHLREMVSALQDRIQTVEFRIHDENEFNVFIAEYTKLEILNNIKVSLPKPDIFCVSSITEIVDRCKDQIGNLRRITIKHDINGYTFIDLCSHPSRKGWILSVSDCTIDRSMMPLFQVLNSSKAISFERIELMNCIFAEDFDLNVFKNARKVNYLILNNMGDMNFLDNFNLDHLDVYKLLIDFNDLDFMLELSEKSFFKNLAYLNVVLKNKISDEILDTLIQIVMHMPYLIKCKFISDEDSNNFDDYLDLNPNIEDSGRIEFE